MKKLVLFAAFAAAISFSSCTGKTEPTTEPTPVEATEAPATETAPEVAPTPAPADTVPAAPATETPAAK